MPITSARVVNGYATSVVRRHVAAFAQREVGMSCRLRPVVTGQSRDRENMRGRMVGLVSTFAVITGVRIAASAAQPRHSGSDHQGLQLTG